MIDHFVENGRRGIDGSKTWQMPWWKIGILLKVSYMMKLESKCDLQKFNLFFGCNSVYMKINIKTPYFVYKIKV